MRCIGLVKAGCWAGVSASDKSEHEVFSFALVLYPYLLLILMVVTTDDISLQIVEPESNSTDTFMPAVRD